MPDQFDAVKGVSILESLARDEIAWVEEVLEADEQGIAKWSKADFDSHMRTIRSVLGAQIAMNMLMTQNLTNIGGQLDKIFRVVHDMGVELGTIPNPDEDSELVDGKYTRAEIIRIGQLKDRLGRIPTEEEIRDEIASDPAEKD